MKNTMKGTFWVIAIAAAVAMTLLPTGTASARDGSDHRVSRPLCDVQVTLTDAGSLDIHMSLRLVLCGKVEEPDVSDTVRGNGLYTIGNSESTGGRLMVTGGRYTNAADDPDRIIVVSAESGPLRGRVYRLKLTTINGCEISGRAELDGKEILTGIRPSAYWNRLALAYPDLSKVPLESLLSSWRTISSNPILRFSCGPRVPGIPSTSVLSRSFSSRTPAFPPLST